MSEWKSESVAAKSPNRGIINVMAHQSTLHFSALTPCALCSAQQEHASDVVHS